MICLADRWGFLESGQDAGRYIRHKHRLLDGVLPLLPQWHIMKCVPPKVSIWSVTDEGAWRVNNAKYIICGYTISLSCGGPAMPSIWMQGENKRMGIPRFLLFRSEAFLTKVTSSSTSLSAGLFYFLLLILPFTHWGSLPHRFFIFLHSFHLLFSLVSGGKKQDVLSMGFVTPIYIYTHQFPHRVGSYLSGFCHWASSSLTNWLLEVQGGNWRGTLSCYTVRAWLGTA